MNKLGGMCSEGYGVNYMEPADLGFRTWMLGGKVMCRKDCWYSHLHVNHRARGYRNPENLITMVYLLLGKLDLGLPTLSPAFTHTK